MSKILDDFDFGARQPLPWGEWLDGRIWQLEHGVDYTIKPASLVATAYKRAAERGGKVRTKRQGDTVVLQYHS